MSVQTFRNGEEVLVTTDGKSALVSGIYSGSIRELARAIEPTAIDQWGNIVQNPWFVNGGKIVLSNRPKTAPTVFWTVSLTAPEQQYVGFELELIGIAMRKSRMIIKHEFYERMAKPLNKRHLLKGLFVIPRDSSVKIWITDDQKNRVRLYAEMANVDGEVVVTMFDGPENMMQALAEVAATFA